MAELLVERVDHADWAMFAKNGSDANTIAVTIARAVSGRHQVLAAAGAYHGSAPWSTPVLNGITPADRASVAYFRFNDIESVRAAVDEAGGDVAAVLISPFKHDAGFDSELVDPGFARQLRALCDRIGAALILDEVRAGFRIAHGGSWEAIGVAPDLSAWSKGMANGYPIAAVLGGAAYAEGASSIYVTGSYWYQAVPMAAAIATINVLGDSDAVAGMVRTGTRLRRGLEAAARSAGVGIRQTGPVQMPTVTFEGDDNYVRANLWCSTAVRHGVVFHPRHNWFLSVAHGDDDIDAAIEVASIAFEAVRRRFGES